VKKLEFSINGLIQLAYIYDKIIIKPKTKQQVEQFNKLLDLGLFEYKGNNEFWLTKKGLDYYYFLIKQ
jgi:hypothetical protein